MSDLLLNTVKSTSSFNLTFKNDHCLCLKLVGGYGPADIIGLACSLWPACGAGHACSPCFATLHLRHPAQSLMLDFLNALDTFSPLVPLGLE